jgi:hypothetical protein
MLRRSIEGLWPAQSGKFSIMAANTLGKADLWSSARCEIASQRLSLSGHRPQLNAR